MDENDSGFVAAKEREKRRLKNVEEYKRKFFNKITKNNKFRRSK